MFENIILRDTNKEDWPAIREKIQNRIMRTMGSFPPESDASDRYEILEKYTLNDLTYVEFKYHLIDGLWNHGTCVLPADFNETKPYTPVLAIHGTNIMGRKQVLETQAGSNRAYGYELAQRGYVVIAVDQYGFGDSANYKGDVDEFLAPMLESFIKRYPDWSIDGLRLLGHKKAMDTALLFDFVKLKAQFGTIGNSQGGRGALYIAAFDERIKCAVVSTGVSPNVTNAYRIVKHDASLNPRLAESMTHNGRAQWEYEEFISLCAPRAVLFLEPFYDDYNPHTLATISCIYNAFNVYKLLDAPQKIALHTHGDGHTTIPSVRNLAYAWLDRFLKEDVCG